MTDHALHADRRERFAHLVGDGIALIPAAREQIRNDDVDHPFRQNSDFFYLTGLDEPDAVALIDPAAPDEQYVLFVRPRDREMEIWNGYRAGVEGAKELYRADAAYPIAELDTQVRQRLVGRSTVYAPLKPAEFRERIAGLVQGVQGLGERYGRLVPLELKTATPLIHELRLHKTPAEIDLLRTACEISAEGHVEAMRFAAPGRYEYQVQAAMEYTWRRLGARREGYGSIVASGDHACVLHYTENDGQLADGDLLLIDAAAEYAYFSADITRTFPVNGTFTKPQRAVYGVVLAAQRASLELCRVGATMKEIHQASVDAVSEGLVELGLVPEAVGETVRMHHYREFFMHGTGHWLGMDVHDAGSYGIDGKPRQLEASMSFTVEPGIYVDPARDTVEFAMLEFDLDEQMERRMTIGMDKAKEFERKEREAAPKVSHAIPVEFRGIGVRVEDDILITEHGSENMTAAVPTDPDEVEALSRETSDLPWTAPR